MAVYKDNATGTWRVIYRFTNWKGERKQTQKRGFATKREAQIFKIQEVLIMQNKLFLKAADICELLEVKQTSAYEIIGNLNKELEEQGYLTLRGKVPTKYFVKRFYGVEDTCEIPQEEGKEWFHA